MLFVFFSLSLSLSLSKSQTQYYDAAIRVSPQAYQAIKACGFIYTDYEAVHVKDKIFVRQCQKCFTFNPDHKTNECTRNTCKDCGTDGNHNCKKNIKCCNCAKHPNPMYQQNTTHKPNSAECPLYKIQIERTRQKTEYFSIDAPSTSQSPVDYDMT